jgi:peroxiredoxin Q/BCP
MVAMVLQVGDFAPEFTLPTDKNEKISLQSLRGKMVILYFYPKDNTPGCTKQACDFRDALPEFITREAVILGISKDSPKLHQKFKAKHMLPFPLLADENGDVCEAFGVINKKSLFGKTFLGVQRSTFLIDEKGVIRAIWRKVRVPGHVRQVLEQVLQVSD